jgi:hypothetical protein
MTGRFEAHLTFDVLYGTEVRKVSDADPTWVFSQITGCPLLGPGTYCYLTGYDTDPEDLLTRMNFVASVVKGRGIPVLRSKIERIVYDTKTGVNEV